jgi:hypothetical protein
MGHLTFISDEIIKLLESYPEKTQEIQKEMDLEAWRDYCSNQLEETKKRNNFTLGDHMKLTNNNMHPITSDEEEEEEEEWDTYKSMNHNETSAGLIVSKQDSSSSSSDEEAEEYHSSGSSDEEEQVTRWTREEPSRWTKEEEEDEQDPFGDFNSFSGETEEMDGFTSNFSDMDIQVTPTA